MRQLSWEVKGNESNDSDVVRRDTTVAINLNDFFTYFCMQNAAN